MTKLSFKTILFGASSVGKTAIFNRLSYNKFNEFESTTVGASYHRLIKDELIFELWDTAGQERYFALSKIYLRNSKFILLIYDLSDYCSLKQLFNYFEICDEEFTVSHSRIIIIGNKLDLMIDTTKIDDFHNAIKKKILNTKFTENYNFIEISAKTGENVDKLLELLCTYATLECENQNVTSNNVIKNAITLLEDKTTDCSC